MGDSTKVSNYISWNYYTDFMLDGAISPKGLKQEIPASPPPGK